MSATFPFADAGADLRPEPLEASAPPSLGRRFLGQWQGVLALLLISVLVLFCFLGPVVHPTDQIHTDIAITNLAPRAGHPLGTDANGYDVLGRLMVGGRDSLEIGVAVAVLATLLGALWGAFAGLTGGVLDAVMMRGRGHPAGAPVDLHPDLSSDHRATHGAAADRGDLTALLAGAGTADPR